MSRQHGVITRAQLRELGFSDRAIEHRLATNRLHPVYRSVYAVGRPELTQLGRWMAAVLACGEGAVLSHASAAALWELRPLEPGRAHVSIVSESRRRVRELVVHRRAARWEGEMSTCQRVPVTSPIFTLMDIAPTLPRAELERAVNEADRLDLVGVETLRWALEEMPPRAGVAILRRLIDKETFRLTRSELERLFLPIVRDAGLPKPETNVRVNGFVVDFHWPELKLVVETDGLRYHRTPAQQKKDRLRDQAHVAAGLTQLRFTHHQVRYDPDHVRRTLAATAAAATR